jgi:phage shock protein A
LESQFAALESGSDIEGELVAMKAQLAGSSPDQAQLPAAEAPAAAPADAAVDEELEALKTQLDNL